MINTEHANYTTHLNYTHYTHFNILQYYSISLSWELEVIAHATLWVKIDAIFIMKVEFFFSSQ